MRESFDDASGDVEPEDAVLRDARLAVDLARGLEGGHDPSRRSPAGATSTTTSGSSTTPTSTAPSSTTSPPSSPTRCGSSSTSGSRRRRERRVPARRPLACRDLRDAAAPAHRSARPVRLLPRRGAGAASGRRSTSKNRSFVIGALVDIPAPGRRGRALRPRHALRRARAVRQGQPAALRQQLRRRRGADDRRLRGHPDRRRPDPVGVVREGGPGADARHRNAVALPRRRRRSARARSRPSSARSRSPARGSTSAATRASRSPTTTPATPRTSSPAARSTGSRSTSAASRTSTSSVSAAMLIRAAVTGDGAGARVLERHRDPRRRSSTSSSA